MPCDTIQRSSVSLELRADNEQLLVTALKNLGYAVQKIGETVCFTTREGHRGVFAKGKLNLSGYRVEQFNTNIIRRAYSVEIVKSQSKRFGWQLSQEDEFTFNVTKQGI